VKGVDVNGWLGFVRGVFLGMLRVVLPPRRGAGRVAWQSVLFLLLFVVLFLSGALFCSLSNVVLFMHPWAFGLCLFFLWVWWVHVTGFSGLAGLRSYLALFVRFVLLGLFVLLLAQPRYTRKSDRLSVMYVVDLSDSLGDMAVRKSIEYVTRTVADKPDRDSVGLIVFGYNVAVELPARECFPYEGINVQVYKDGTNLQKALSFASTMLPDDKLGKVVLISDGTETEGDVTSVLPDLKAHGVAVDVLPVGYSYGKEVWLEKLIVPKKVVVGKSYEVSVVLSALSSGRGELVLMENDKEIFRQKVDYQAGKNRYEIPIYLRGSGYYEYVAKIEVKDGEDGWKENNIALNYIYIGGKGRVMLVVDPEGNSKDYEEVKRMLLRMRRRVDVQTAYEFPSDVLSLLDYDCIVFANVPADELNSMQMQALKDAVDSQGTGFLMIGGDNSFGAGGYHRTAVEEILPVTMDIKQKKVIPRGGLVIVLHTCEFPEGNTWGKRITKQAVRVLGSRDEVGVLVYDCTGGEKWLFPMTLASEYDKIAKLINGAQIGDMPSFQTIMTMGFNELMASDVAVKHMIIISDGDPQPPTSELLKKFVDNQISISNIAIFPHGSSDISMMRRVSAITGGRYYFPPNANLLPSIFIKEAKTLKRSLLQNMVFQPEVVFSSQILKGLNELPQLKGYVLTTAKPRATVILKVPDLEQLDPVLATWRFGLGKTAAFTSDLSTHWGVNWLCWKQGEAFFKQLIEDISRVKSKSNLYFDLAVKGTTGQLVIDDQMVNGEYLQFDAVVRGPNGREDAVCIKQVGARRYEGEFPIWGRGRYRVVLSGVGGERVEKKVGRLVVPYSKEYLHFSSNPILLKKIATETGGKVLRGDELSEDIFSKKRQVRLSSSPIFDWLLLIIIIVFLFDVAVRRIQLDWLVIRGYFGVGSKKTSSMETMSALLKRKKDIVFVQNKLGMEKDLAYNRIVRDNRLSATKTRVDTSKTDDDKVLLDDNIDTKISTTSHLLAKKKRWNKEE